jgi:glycosyltransferase involved in cell wall biosynthesis
MVRILHVMRSLEVGGVEVGVRNLARQLARRGHRQAVACLVRKGALAGDLTAWTDIYSCDSDASPNRVATVFRLAKIVRHFSPDVVHARNCVAWSYAGPAWLLAGRPGKLMFSIHGLDWAGAIPRRNVLEYRFLATWTSELLAVSAATADGFSLASGIPRSRFRVLHSGVDLHVFRPRPRGTGYASAAGTLSLVCVARLSRFKGHETLLRACRLLRNDRGKDFRLTIVGDGPERARLEALSQLLGVDDVVTFAGERQDTAELLRASDVFVLSSVQEGRPTSVMEAMASGVPVIATDVGAVRELVQQELTGLLVPPGDVGALAGALCHLAGDSKLREAMGLAGRRFAEKNFSLESMANAYSRVYATVAGISNGH